MLIFGVAGCITSGSKEGSAAYDLDRSGDMDRLAGEIANRRVIFVGETHNRVDHHRLQLEIIEALYRSGLNLAIGVEWFQYPKQPVVDDFLAGRIDEADLLHRSEWYERWRFDYRLYGDIIRFARDNQIPMLALNAPREVTSAVSSKGLAHVPPDVKASLPASYDRSNTDYESKLREVFELHWQSPHGGKNVNKDVAKDKRFTRFLEVQLTWDETMAEKSADYLAANPKTTLVVLAGSGHVAYGAGIPDRVQRRYQAPAVIILPADYAAVMPGGADLFVATDAEELPKSGMLGVFLSSEKTGLTITAFSEESGAKEAGLGVGDRILRIDGKPVPTLAALKLALGGRPPGENVEVDYEKKASAKMEHATVTLR